MVHSPEIVCGETRRIRPCSKDSREFRDFGDSIEIKGGCVATPKPSKLARGRCHACFSRAVVCCQESTKTVRTANTGKYYTTSKGYTHPFQDSDSRNPFTETTPFVMTPCFFPILATFLVWYRSHPLAYARKSNGLQFWTT